LGYPLTDETSTPDGFGRYNHFQGGSIYWTLDTGAHEVHGDIREKWASLGWERSFLGYPLTDETETPDGFGRYNHFQGGSIYWTLDTGAHEVHGDIREKWASLGWEQSFLGYPLSDETVIPDGVERYSQFQAGLIVAAPDTGAQAIPAAGRTVILYANTGFKGKKVLVSEGQYDADDLLEPFRYWVPGRFGNSLQQAGLRSLQVLQGMEIQLFTESGWRGNTITITSDTSDLGRQWNDKTASVIVRDPTNQNLKVTLWRNKNYDGSRVLLSPGRHDIQELQLMNDRITAVEVPPGLVAMCYEHSRFSGRLLASDHSIPRIDDYINDKISSVVVAAESEYTKHLREREAHAGALGEPPHMDDFHLTDQTTKPLLVGEFLLPFIYVEDPYWPPEVQAQRSPYYIFSREQFWHRHSFGEHPSGLEETITLRYKEGASLETLHSFKKTTKWEIAGAGKISLDFFKGVGFDASGKFESIGEETTTTTEKEFIEIEKTEQIKFGADSPRKIVALWGMIDRYDVRRITGERLGPWDVALPGVIKDSYPR
jgi:LGFP repeat-containing protein/insecticidal crystal toxin P42 protein